MCVCTCLCVCACMCVCVRVYVCVCVRMCVCVTCVSFDHAATSQHCNCSIADAYGALPPAPMLTSIPLTPPTINAQALVAPTATTPQGVLPPALPPPQGLILSPASSPFPQKLVDKIHFGQFIEMRELLMDNIALIQQLEALQSSTPIPMIGPTRPRLREISTLSSWLYCFLAYVAILTTDRNTRDKLAYARLIIREALRHGNMGWLDYDRAFRQQTVADPSLAWNTLIPALQATTVLGNTARASGRTVRICALCRGVDHLRSDCALHFLYPQFMRPPQSAPSGSKPKICISWNKGTCIFPNTCTYNHACATCPGSLPHKACDCPRTSEDSIFKQRRSTNK